MSRFPRVFLRLSLGYLLVIWGVDKLVNPAHGLAVSSRFYFGLFSLPWLMTAFGVAQVTLGALVMAGLWKRYTYPVVVAITGMTVIGVWRSILDPWGWWLTGSNALFYPSLIIFAAALVLLVEDTPTHVYKGHDA
ncbi:MAG: DoxX family membrane protein [Acidobacteria bacterium]|nr:DoxX family membrane protein [Acidobacteriota bacterium]